MEKVRLEGEEAKELVMAAFGNPHLIIVHGKGDNKEVYGKITGGFDFDYLFNFMLQLAESDKKFKERLCNFVIDASKIM